MPITLPVIDLGSFRYQPAWDKQLEIHAQVESGTYPDGVIILVEHPPVVTVGRHPGSRQHLLASEAYLAKQGVELVETDRGGDITFHGPGQLVAYPIIPLNRYALNLHSYMRTLEEAVIRTIARSGIAGHREDGATGVWVNLAQPDKTGLAGACCTAADPALLSSAKICAMGVKFRRWISLHGLALNVTTNLQYFELINPCGLGRPVTSYQKLLGDAATPAMTDIKNTFVAELDALLGEIAAKKTSAASSSS